jgi:hypothetical protein
VPKRLHCNGRDIIEEFYDGELLYRRSKKDKMREPFSITLVDLSVNRQGKVDDILSEEEDVLLNLDVDGDDVTYDGMYVVKMKVLNEENQYKTYLYTSGPVRMQLIHEPLDCNYSHSIFKIWYNDVVTSFDNWNEGLGAKKARLYRTSLRNELGKMIIREVELNI